MVRHAAMILTIRACGAPRQMAKWFPDPLYDTPSIECLQHREKLRD